MPSDEVPDIRLLTDRAIGFHEAGNLSEAKQLYLQILALDPRHADALHLLGVIAYQAGESALAVDMIDRAIGINGRVAAYHSNRGNALRAVGRLEEAVASYDAALGITPDYADAHHNRGSVLADLGRLEDALMSYDAALRINQHQAKTLLGRGNVLKSLGRPAEALASYDDALRARPDYTLAYDARGHALKDLGRFDEALASHDAALRLKPAHAEAHYGRGNALASLGRFAEALAAYDAALLLKPEYVEVHNDRGNALADLMRFQDALESYDTALRLMPDYVAAHANRGNVLKDLGRFEEALASYERAIQLKPDYVDAHNNLIYCLHYGLNVDGAAIQAAARRFGAIFSPSSPAFPNSPDPARRLRVGLVSGDLGRHPVGYFLLPFLAKHSPREVEVYCYTTQLRNDGLAASLKASADHWRSLVGVSDAAACAQIRADAIDILVDLSGHTSHNRLPLFARRAAPVQATWLGYWGTTGLATMDYILSDLATIPPAQEAFYDEQVWRLAGGRFCYAPPSYAPEPATLPCLRAGAVTFGSFNHLGKVGPEVVALWAQVLRAVPGSRLLLKWRSLANAGVRQRLTEGFAAHGIPSDRLVMRAASPHPEMLAEYGDMDIALDPFPFSGGLTSCEALWMGVPVITLPGAGGPSRQTLGFLTALGLEELAASSPAEYIRIAANLAARREYLGELRQSLRARMANSPLCDSAGFARKVEAAFRTMWRNWCAQTDRP